MQLEKDRIPSRNISGILQINHFSIFGKLQADFHIFSYYFLFLDFFCICLCILSTFFHIIFILKNFFIFSESYFFIFSEKNLKPRIPILQGYVCLKSRWHKHQNVFSMGAHINHRTWFFCAIYSETAIHKL